MDTWGFGHLAGVSVGRRFRDSVYIGLGAKGRQLLSIILYGSPLEIWITTLWIDYRGGRKSMAVPLA